MQLFRGDKKILSIWPVKPGLESTTKWKYQGHTYKLSRGAYRWYVWPGFGGRKAVDYGEMLGFSTFQVVSAELASRNRHPAERGCEAHDRQEGERGSDCQGQHQSLPVWMIIPRPARTRAAMTSNVMSSRFFMA